MAIRQIQQSFRTSDSEEFKIQDDAEKHEAVLTAKENFETAAREYGEAMLDEAVTADGERFELSSMCDYYHINTNHLGMPNIRQVSFYLWNCHYDLRDGLTISQQLENKYHSFAVKELYRHEKNAKRALIKAQRERIQEFTEQTDNEEKNSST